MGRHSASYLAAQQRRSTGVGAAKYVGRVGALAFAMGVGAAIASGTAVANADGLGSSPNDDGGVSSAAAPGNGGVGLTGRAGRQQTATTVSTSPTGLITRTLNGTAALDVRSLLQVSPLGSTQPRSAQTHTPPGDPVGTGTGGSPVVSTVGLSATQTTTDPIVAPGIPRPSDVVQTPYGSIGKWMIQSDGQISNYGGQPYAGKTLLEPVNVIVLDPNSTSAAESTAKLNRAMSASGFPAQPIHSGGFKGIVNGTIYDQQPSGPLLGYSDDIFVLPNNHGRMFGPAPVAATNGTGYVWTGAFSRETLGLFNLLPTHSYVSSNAARYALALRLLASGQATLVGMVKLDNAVDDATTTTGDHDGYAIVLQLN